MLSLPKSDVRKLLLCNQPPLPQMEHSVPWIASVGQKTQRRTSLCKQKLNRRSIPSGRRRRLLHHRKDQRHRQRRMKRRSYLTCEHRQQLSLAPFPQALRKEIERTLLHLRTYLAHPRWPNHSKALLRMTSSCVPNSIARPLTSRLANSPPASQAVPKRTNLRITCRRKLKH